MRQQAAFGALHACGEEPVIEVAHDQVLPSPQFGRRPTRSPELFKIAPHRVVRRSAISWRNGDSLFVRGEVEMGDQRGRELGFPTANIAVEHLDIDEGVWAGWLIRKDDVVQLAAISVGRRETIYGRSGLLLLEAHVLDFSADLYSSVVTVELGHWVRHQQRFRSLVALSDQLAADIQACRDWVGGTGPSEGARG